MTSVIRILAWLQHGLLVVLSTVCLTRSLLDGAPPLLLVPLLGAFAAWYLLGTRLAVGRIRQGWWLAVLTLLWIGMVAVSPHMVWLAFSLWMLAGHFLPWGWAVGYSLLTLVVVIGGPLWTRGHLQLAEVVGPAIGALFALVMSRGQVELAREARERQVLIDSLVAAQAETEQLSGDLALAQREAGALAERTRLSRDIHDTLAQGFSSIVLLARSAGVTADEQGLRDIVARIEHTAADNLAEARRVVAALAPGDLAEGSLPAALGRLVDAFTADTGVTAELRLDGELDALPTRIEVALLRTAQGALANVRTHAHADRAVVSLSNVGDEIRLDIVDDGVGFDPAGLDHRAVSPWSGGYGLPSTRARLRELGGGLEVESTPGEGTALSAHIPLTVPLAVGPRTAKGPA